MKNSNYIFIPKKLKETTKSIKKDFPSINQLAERKEKKYSNFELEDLLDEIKELKSNEIKFYSSNLKNRKLYALSYNFNQISDDLLNKTSEILIYRAKKSIVKIMWNNFSKEPENQHIINFFDKINKQLEYITFSTKPYTLLKNIFSNTEPLKVITNHILKSKLKYEEWLKLFKLKSKNRLTQKIIISLFTTSQKEIFEQEDEELLYDLFSALKFNDFLKVSENYLEIFEVEKFSALLMSLYKDRLGDPVEEYSVSWQKISDIAYKKARKWFNIKELEDFFADIKESKGEAKRRFNYWKKYINELDNNKLEKIKYIKSQLQLFLVFKNFVVIEFGEKNNAIYIYDKELFENRFAKYMNEENTVKNKILKNTGLAIEWISHNSGWEMRVDAIIDKLIKGVDINV